MEWLARLRWDSVFPELPPGKQQFTRSEAVNALGISETAFRDAVKRQGLVATGTGPAPCTSS